MAGKKTAAKTTKQKRPAPAKPAAARKPAPRKVAAPSRPAAAAAAAAATATAKPAARSAKSTERASEPVAESSRTPPAAAAHPSAAFPSRRTTAAVNSIVPVEGRNSGGSRTLPAAESDESDAVEPGSLLAGPRNVKPYVAKRGEQYMSKEQLAHFQQILANWKRDLMEEVDRTVSHMKDEAANFPDPNDRATQEEEFSLELRTRDRERKLIRKIEEALKRTEDGSYGYCLETGEEIGIKRLEARPVATLTIEAQERRERRERQYGDRDDRYR
jgi:DnaK suppressor protein